MRNRKVSGAALRVGMAVVLAFAGAAAARADDSKEQLEQRVKDLEKQLTEVKDQMRGGYFTANSDIEARVAELERSSAAGSNGMSSAFSAGMKSSTEDGAFAYQWKGRVQNDWVWYVNQGTKHLRTADVADQNPEFGFRRVYLGAEGKYYGNVKWAVNIDFSQQGQNDASTSSKQGDISFRETYMELDHCGDWAVRVGLMKEPFGLDTLTSDLFTTFLERNAVHRTFSPNYNGGILGWTHPMDGWLFQGGIFRDSNDAGNSINTGRSGAYNFTARFSGRPILEDDGNTWLHLGVAASIRNFSGNLSSNNVKVQTNPPIPFGTAFGPATFSADDGNLIGLEAAYNSGPWCAKAEWCRYKADENGVYPASGNIVGQSGARFHAWSVEGSYWITGETNTYDKDMGSFGRVSPLHNYGDGDGMGALQAAARFDSANISQNDSGGVNQSSLTLGANWWLNPNTRVSMNLIHVWYENISERTNALAFRFQWDF